MGVMIKGNKLHMYENKINKSKYKTIKYNSSTYKRGNPNERREKEDRQTNES